MFGFRSSQTASDALPDHMIQAIEDAILLGHVTELDRVLELLEGDVRIPDDLRYGIEALRHFRAFYGKGGISEPAQHLLKQKTVILETAWGAELLEKLKQHKARLAQTA